MITSADISKLKELRELGATRIEVPTGAGTLVVAFAPPAEALNQSEVDAAVEELARVAGEQLGVDDDIEWGGSGLKPNDDAWDEAAAQVRSAARGETENDDA